MTDQKDHTFIRCRVSTEMHAQFKSRCAALQLRMEDVERALIRWWMELPDEEAQKYKESISKN